MRADDKVNEETKGKTSGSRRRSAWANSIRLRFAEYWECAAPHVDFILRFATV